MNFGIYTKDPKNELVNTSGYNFEGMRVIKSLEEFKNSDIILLNRLEDDLLDLSEKVYTRDIFNRD